MPLVVVLPVVVPAGPYHEQPYRGHPPAGHSGFGEEYTRSPAIFFRSFRAVCGWKDISKDTSSEEWKCLTPLR